jgi:hypothetical protein
MIYFRTETYQGEFQRITYVTKIHFSAWVMPALLWATGLTALGLAFIFLGIVAS